MKRSEMMVPPPMEEEPVTQPPGLEQSRVQHKREEAKQRVGAKTYESVMAATPRSQTYASGESGETQEVIYDPTMIAKGGEHFVFDFEHPKHRDTIYKVNFFRSLPVLHATLRGAYQEREAVRHLNEDMEEAREKIGALRAYFGFDAVPPSQFMVRDVPITRDILTQLDPGFQYPGRLPEKIPAWIQVQKKIRLDPDATVDIGAPIVERRQARLPESAARNELLDRAQELLMNPDLAEQKKLTQNDQEMLALSMFPNFLGLRQLLQSEPEFRTAFQQTVQELIAYTEDTGNAMDLVGANNFVITKTENDGWRPRILDPFLPRTANLKDPHRPGKELSEIESLSLTAKRLSEGTGMNTVRLIATLNTMSTVRTINALATLAGISERLRVPHVADVPAATWRESFASLFKPQTQQTVRPGTQG